MNDARPQRGKRRGDNGGAHASRQSPHKKIVSKSFISKQNNGNNNNKDRVEWGVLVLSTAEPSMLHEFLKEFSYEVVDDTTLPGIVDERNVAEKVKEASAVSVVQHDHIDLALLEEEWLSFSRVGTPGSLTYIELMSPLQNAERTMRMGRTHRLAEKQTA